MTNKMKMNTTATTMRIGLPVEDTRIDMYIMAVIDGHSDGDQDDGGGG